MELGVTLFPGIPSGCGGGQVIGMQPFVVAAFALWCCETVTALGLSWGVAVCGGALPPVALFDLGRGRDTFFEPFVNAGIAS